MTISLPVAPYAAKQDEKQLDINDVDDGLCVCFVSRCYFHVVSMRSTREAVYFRSNAVTTVQHNHN